MVFWASMKNPYVDTRAALQTQDVSYIQSKHNLI